MTRDTSLRNERRLHMVFCARKLVLASVAVVGTTGCSVFGPDTDHFTIRVDSISAPSSSPLGVALRVSFFGGIGPDLCSGLERVEKQTTQNSLDITFRGERRSGQECLQMPSFLEHQEVLQPPLQDPFRVTVHQPGGTLLERVIRIQ